MNHDRTLVCSCKEGWWGLGAERGWMVEGAVVCQVEDVLTLAPGKLLNETEGVATNG